MCILTLNCTDHILHAHKSFFYSLDLNCKSNHISASHVHAKAFVLIYWLLFILPVSKWIKNIKCPHRANSQSKWNLHRKNGVFGSSSDMSCLVCSLCGTWLPQKNGWLSEKMHRLHTLAPITDSRDSVERLLALLRYSWDWVSAMLTDTLINSFDQGMQSLCGRSLTHYCCVILSVLKWCIFFWGRIVLWHYF